MVPALRSCFQSVKVAFGLNELWHIGFLDHLGNNTLDAAKLLVKQMVCMQVEEAAGFGLVYCPLCPGHRFFLWVTNIQT